MWNDPKMRAHTSRHTPPRTPTRESGERTSGGPSCSGGGEPGTVMVAGRPFFLAAAAASPIPIPAAARAATAAAAGGDSGEGAAATSGRTPPSLTSVSS